MELEFTSITERINHLKTSNNLILPELFGRRIGYSEPQYPGFYHIHHIEGYSVSYFDDAICKEFDASLEDIIALKSEFAKMVIHPKDYERVMNTLKTLADSQDQTKIINFFYRLKLKTEQQDGYVLVITSVKLNLENNTFVCITNTTDQLPIFSKKICNALNDNFNIKKVIRLYLRLTKREKEITSQLFQGKKAKEIAKELFISERTIEQHKKNIFRKMEVHSMQELMRLASNIEDKIN